MKVWMKPLGILLLLTASLPLAAQGLSSRGRVDRFGGQVQWRWDVDFHYFFVNGEFDASGSSVVPSGTIHAAVLVPTVSAQIRQSRNILHSLTVGGDFQHDMGSQTWKDFPREGVVYYDGVVRLPRGVFEGIAGIFPRERMACRWSEAFFTDKNRFLDRNFEGMLLKWTTPRLRTEVALDWMGARGYDRKERFQFLFCGDWKALPERRLTLGWNTDYYHYAGSEVAPGVVENYLAHFWLRTDFSAHTSMQQLSLQAGVLPAFQRDHRDYEHPFIPVGGEVEAVARRWNVTLSNTCYFGGDLQPFFGGVDTAGRPLADNLYFGSRFYTGFYDRINLSWEPRIASFVHLRLFARAYFAGAGFMGWQSIVSLRFDAGAPIRSRR